MENNIGKLAILSKLTYRFNATPNESPEIDKLILKFIWKGKGHRRVKTILKMRNRVGGFALDAFKTYYKIAVIRMVGYGMRIDIDQWNRIESPEIDPYCVQNI